jgi:hypothetical protein
VTTVLLHSNIDRQIGPFDNITGVFESWRVRMATKHTKILSQLLSLFRNIADERIADERNGSLSVVTDDAKPLMLKILLNNPVRPT